MKHTNIKALSIAAAFLSCLVGPARADLNAHLIALDTFQKGTSGIIQFGTVVTASTNLNALWASADFRIDCSDPAIRPAITGKRGWSDNGIKGPRNIYVTVPEWVPAEQELPGWTYVMGGTFVSCVNTQNGYAKTHILPIGTGGTAFPVGGDGWEETKTTTFGQIKPGTRDGGGLCIF
jgi:hypothetical protein